MLYVNYHDRLGNNLFQFVFGWLLAREAGVPLSCKPLPLFPGTRGFDIGQPASFKHKIGLRDSGLVKDWVDKARDGDLLVMGWPFKIVNYLAHRAAIRQLLEPVAGPYEPAASSDLVLHLRQGDYVGIFAYPMESIFRLLHRLEYDRLLIVTDSIETAAVKALVRNHRGVLVSKDVAHDYRTLYHAERLVLTPSTFGWWPGFTGCNKSLWQPSELGYWKRENGIDLTMPWATSYDSNGKTF